MTKGRNKRVAGYSEHFNLRLPPALKADLADAAERNGISLNEELVRRLMSPQRQYRSGLTREQWNELMELEPQLGDSRSTQEICEQMEQIHPVGPMFHVEPNQNIVWDSDSVSFESLPGSALT